MLHIFLHPEVDGINGIFQYNWIVYNPIWRFFSSPLMMAIKSE